MNKRTPKPAEALDLRALRERLKSAKGPAFWRCLDEVADTPAFRELVENEFPHGAPVLPKSEGVRLDLSRRNFVKLMGASLALTGVTSCARQPVERIVPYVKPPEEVVPGKPLFFASAMPRHGYGVGVVVESHMGRPTKVEGNPGHPASLGGTSPFEQAAVLSLYDPDRGVNVRQTGTISTWDDFVAAIQKMLPGLKEAQGEGLRILTETVTSPTIAGQMRAILDAMPKARWHKHDPGRSETASAVSRRLYGRPLERRYDFSKADVVLALDADFLGSGPAMAAYNRQFAARRLQGDDPAHATMNRLYVLETTPAVTGANADHRRGVSPAQLEQAAASLAETPGANPPEGLDAFLAAVDEDLQAHRGRCLVIAGDHAPASVHEAADSLNKRLGNIGETVTFIEPVEAMPADGFYPADTPPEAAQAASLKALTEDISSGRVELLLILGGNPVYTAPGDIGFAAALETVPLRAHLSLHEDETSALCQWHVPETHWLETWADVRAFDGTASIVQPLIAPLYEGCHTATEVLDILLEQNRDAFAIVQTHWRERQPDDFDRFWERSLSEGVVADTAFAAVTPNRTGQPSAPRDEDADGVTLLLRPDPTIDDGSWANNGWMQELPKPLTKITWDNALLVGPAMAERLGLNREQLATVTAGERTLEVPVWIQPGHPDGCATLHLGYGRELAGSVGSGVGVNAYPLQSAANGWTVPGVVIEPAGGQYPLARTESHHALTQHGRPLARMGTLAEYQAHPEFAQHMVHKLGDDVTMYERELEAAHQWGMTIDLNRCTGCNACITACQSENNIPIVGKEQVAVGREMHWIRVDRYYTGDDLDEPGVVHQPVPCMQCEKAPCEVVCPVAATVHSEEGLNDMVYNRCVGTRYCSNNCPYKVRRFNFLHYTKSQYGGEQPASLEAMRNPDVTVRSRGVMEKCTYCVQRINAARIEAKKEGRKVRDGEIRTACQQACPADAILFGDISDGDSGVVRKKASPRNYGLLEEIGTRPRTTYLARLRNPNPALEPETPHDVHGGAHDGAEEAAHDH